MGQHPRIDAALSTGGDEYIIVSQEKRSACVSRHSFMTNEKEVKGRLARAGIQILGARAWQQFLQRVAEAEPGTDRCVIQKTGWNGTAFAMPSGAVFAPDNPLNYHIAFETSARKCCSSGTLKRWQRHVAAPLAGQDLATFILCAMFAAPLLTLVNRADNFGFEIVGGKGTGKSTLQYIASSVAGGAIRGEQGHYWVTLDTTVNALEDTMRAHADLPIVMDEANLLGAGLSPKRRSDMFHALAFKLASGSQKCRLGGEEHSNFRCIYVISSNDTLASQLGQSTESARAASDRLITLPLARDRPYGVYDYLPGKYQSASEFGEAVMSAAAENYGHALGAFLAQLVKARAADSHGLEKQLRGEMLKFRRKAGVDPNNGSAVRVADAFGLVYVAGKLCQRYGILPRQLKVGQAARKCHEMHLASIAGRDLAMIDRLKALVDDPRVASLDEGATVRADAIAFVKKKKSRIELIVPKSDITRVFPDWEKIAKSKDLGDHLIRDGKHLTTKRRVGGNRSERVYCFRM